MINLREATLSIFLIITSFICIAQTEEPENIEIDPRQYITVMYSRNPSRKIFDTAWNFEKRTNVPDQKFYYLDIDGHIKITFDKKNLIKNNEFFGTFTLEAEISGTNGTRKIEVNPYSEIGVERVPIGIKSDPPFELAKKLINIQKALSDISPYYDKAKIVELYLDFPANRRNLENEIDKMRHAIKDAKNDPSYQIDFLKSSIKGIIIDAQTKLSYLPPDSLILENLKKHIDKNKNDLTALSSDLTDAEKIIIESFSGIISIYKKDLELVYKYLNSKVSIVIEYLNSFENGGEEAFNALLSLTNKDKINYASLKANLISQQKSLSNIQPIVFDTDIPTSDSIALSYTPLFIESLNYLNTLSRFKGSRIESIIKSFYNRKLKNIDTLNEKEYFDFLNNFGDSIAYKISERAGELIYKKLIYATIDLGKSGAKDGEVLNIYLTWVLDSKKDSVGNSPRPIIGKFYLRQTGWNVQVADMFSLVNRIAPSKSIDPAHLSPSNFKGSGGGVLMWSYQKEDKGLEINRKADSSFTVNRTNRFLNFLEPSIGLNVSYLDFNTSKDVEIGTGIQLGLFKNKIFFGYGVNLHLLYPKDAPYYFFIGFSFAKIQDLFKDSKSISSLQ